MEDEEQQKLLGEEATQLTRAEHMAEHPSFDHCKESEDISSYSESPPRSESLFAR